MNHRHHPIDGCGCCRAMAWMLGVAVIAGIALTAGDFAKYLKLRRM